MLPKFVDEGVIVITHYGYGFRDTIKFSHIVDEGFSYHYASKVSLERNEMAILR